MIIGLIKAGLLSLKPNHGGAMNGEMDQMKSPLQKMHERLGCYTCRFADKEALGKNACCNHNGRIEIDDDGKCKMWEEDYIGF